jgi:hypothetical protein
MDHIINMVRFASPESLYSYLLKLLLGTSKVDNAGLIEQLTVRDEVPVLIIGGGPTGLLSAALLSRLGSKLMPDWSSRIRLKHSDSQVLDN